MSAGARPPRPRGETAESGRPRAQLSHHLVASSAVDLVERHGLTALTMRGLAASLGVEAMSIYHYYPSRDALLNAMVEKWMDSAVPPDLLDLGCPRDWREHMASLAAAVRQAALMHPQTFPLVVDHGTDDPILHPPLRRASWYQQVLLDLTAGGLDAVDAAVVCHRFADFLLGYLLAEVAHVHTTVGLVDVSVTHDVIAPPLRHPAWLPRSLLGATWAVVLSRRQTDADFTSALDGFLRWTASMGGV